VHPAGVSEMISYILLFGSGLFISNSTETYVLVEHRINVSDWKQEEQQQETVVVRKQ
jgi:hypothetical protein